MLVLYIERKMTRLKKVWSYILIMFSQGISNKVIALVRPVSKQAPTPRITCTPPNASKPGWDYISTMPDGRPTTSDIACLPGTVRRGGNKELITDSGILLWTRQN
jgi:hypothetical protein